MKYGARVTINAENAICQWDSSKVYQIWTGSVITQLKISLIIIANLDLSRFLFSSGFLPSIDRLFCLLNIQ